MKKLKTVLISVLCTVVVLGIIAVVFWFAAKPGLPKKVQLPDGVTELVWTFPNGEYEGETILGRMEGLGKFTFNTGEILEGTFSDNDIVNGKCKYSNGTYEGEFQNTQRHGGGTFTWEDGTVFSGEWANDQLFDGTITTPSGIKYKGTFQNNKFDNGEITATVNSDSYELSVSGGTLSKQISIKFASGTTYYGEYLQGKIHGDGTMTYTDGSKYSGDYSEGLRSGDGNFTFSNGDKYSGKWKNDKMDGYGKYTWDYQTYLTGTFVSNTLSGTYSYSCSLGTFTTVWSNNKCTSITK